MKFQRDSERRAYNAVCTKRTLLFDYDIYVFGNCLFRTAGKICEASECCDAFDGKRDVCMAIAFFYGFRKAIHPELFFLSTPPVWNTEDTPKGNYEMTPSVPIRHY